MSSRFVSEPFDIAPLAPRHSTLAKGAFIGGLLFASMCAWQLSTSVRLLTGIQTAQIDIQAALRAQRDSLLAAQLQQNEPAALQRLKARQKLDSMMRLGWSGLFEALESAALALRGGVTILTLSPSKTEADSSWVDITAVAVSMPMMLDYLRLLKADRHVDAVKMTMHQPDDKAGPDAVRFRIAILWRSGAPTRLYTPSGTPSSDINDPDKRSVLPTK